MKPTLTSTDLNAETEDADHVQIHAELPNGNQYRVVGIEFDTDEGVYVLELV